MKPKLLSSVPCTLPLCHEDLHVPMGRTGFFSKKNPAIFYIYIYIFADSLYFSDWRQEAIIQLKKHNPSQSELVVREVDKINGIKVFDPADQPKPGELDVLCAYYPSKQLILPFFLSTRLGYTTQAQY